jgi:hypothetical protein
MMICAMAVLMTMAAAVPAAKADKLGMTEGRHFGIALVGFEDEVPMGAAISGTLMIEMHDEGASGRVPTTITTWVQTPLGRGVLNSQIRNLKPGQTTTVPVATTFNTRAPLNVDRVEVTFGVTVSVKDETLETSHTMTFVQN